MQSYQAVCLVCGLAKLVMIYIIVKVDIFAIALSAFPLLYSSFLAETARIEVWTDQKLSVFSRKKDMQNARIICGSMRGVRRRK